MKLLKLVELLQNSFWPTQIDKPLKISTISRSRRSRISTVKKKTKTTSHIGLFPIDRDTKTLYDIVEDFKILLNLPEDVNIKIKWGRKAKRILGSVRLRGGYSVIIISKYLSDFHVPEYVLQEVILHEMIHVKTGHGSTLDKQYQHAHRGGVIRKEMEGVSKGELYDIAEAWIKANWWKHIRSYNYREKKFYDVQS